MSIAAPVREVGQFGRLGEAFVLLILSQGRSYGYELRQRLQDEFEFQKAATDPGAVYRLLREMESAGYIASEWDTSGDSGPARRYYQLTDAGRGQLEMGAERLARQERRIRKFFAMYDEWIRS